MINLYALIPDTNVTPCIVNTGDIDYLYTDKIAYDGSIFEIFLVKLKHVEQPLRLSTITFSNKITIDILNKITFAINAAKGVNADNKDKNVNT